MLKTLLLLVSISLFAQDAPKPEQKKGPPPAPKNLKLLQPSEVRAAMRAYRIALGGQCTMCHVQGDFASDENPHKEIARKMIVMTRDINAKFPDAATDKVSCYTCHRGDAHPITAPPADAAKPPAAQ